MSLFVSNFGNLERNNKKGNEINTIRKLRVIKETCHEAWEFISAVHVTPLGLF